MKARMLRELAEKQLEAKLLELRRDILKVRTQVATGASPKNAGQIRRARRTVARIKTILTQRGSKVKHE